MYILYPSCFNFFIYKVLRFVSAFQVLFPTIPSTVKPFACWNARTAWIPGRSLISCWRKEMWWERQVRDLVPAGKDISVSLPLAAMKIQWKPLRE